MDERARGKAGHHLKHRRELAPCKFDVSWLYFPLPTVLKICPGWMTSKMIPNFDVESQVLTNQAIITLSSCGLSL
jgi:hypothetical protein